jgi:hypothetical protein
MPALCGDADLRVGRERERENVREEGETTRMSFSS